MLVTQECNLTVVDGAPTACSRVKSLGGVMVMSVIVDVCTMPTMLYACIYVYKYSILAYIV